MSFGRTPTVGGKTADGRFPQLRFDMISDFILEFAVDVHYWKAMQCPCINPDTGQPSIACAECRGLGWFYTDRQTKQKYLKAQVHSRRSQKQLDEGGISTTGYSSMTFQPGVIPGDGDLIQVCKDREIVNSEYHIVGATLQDGSTSERFRFRDVICVETVVELDDTTKAITTVPTTEWTFNASTRKIDFNPARPIGKKYSIRYVAVPEFIVLGETVKPLVRVSHDESRPDFALDEDVIYPFNVQAIRLDRAVVQRQRGAVDLTTQSTFNNPEGIGPFR